MSGNYVYTPQYKDTLFYLWWKLGKPSAGKFLLEIPAQDDGKLPNQLTIQTWIREDWTERAKPLEDQIRQELENRLVAEKIKMFEEQSKQAKDLRQKAYEWLVEHSEDLTPSVAVRLWETCIGIEQTVSGVPEALEKMMKMSNEELVEATQKALIESTVDGTAT